MKRIQIKWYKAYNVIISAILGILGITALSCAKDYGTSICEYGTPSATFVVLGKVTDSQTNQPIKDIQIKAYWETVYTDSNGNYTIDLKDLFPKSQTIPIKFQDIDGDLNGLYMDLDTIVEFKDPKFTGGDSHWYEGKTTQEFNIQLNPKE